MLFLILWTLSITQTQSLSKAHIHACIQRTYPQAQLDSQTLYILNGNLVKGPALDSVLASYTIQELKTVDYIDEAIQNLFCTPPKSVVVICTKMPPTKKRLQRHTKKAPPSSSHPHQQDRVSDL